MSSLFRSAFLEIRKNLMEEEIKGNDPQKKVAGALAEAIIQKSKDFRAARYKNLQLGEQFRVRDYRVRRAAADARFPLRRPETGVVHLDS